MYPRKSTSSAKGATKHPTPTLSTDIFALIEEVTANARSMGNAATKENAAAGLMIKALIYVQITNTAQAISAYEVADR